MTESQPAKQSPSMRARPQPARSHTARPRDVSQSCVGNRQAVRPPSTTVKDFVPDIGFEFGAIGVCKVSAICAARMFFDDARFPADTERAPDVEEFAALADGEHLIIASINAVYCCSVVK